MDTKNTIIQNFASSLASATNTIVGTSQTLNDNIDENIAIVATLNVLLESVRSQTVLLQKALDDYNK